MAEMRAATLVLPAAPVECPGVTLALAPPARRFSLRARDGAVLGQATGLTLPTRIGDFRDGVAMLGPDEWFVILDSLPPAADVAGAHPAPLSIVDVSSRSLGITVTGPAAAEIISAGCPLDLARMAPGRATRTVFETVEIILIRHAQDHFTIDVWRSFAPWLFAALVIAAPA